MVASVGTGEGLPVSSKSSSFSASYSTVSGSGVEVLMVPLPLVRSTGRENVLRGRGVVVGLSVVVVERSKCRTFNFGFTRNLLLPKRERVVEGLGCSVVTASSVATFSVVAGARVELGLTVACVSRAMLARAGRKFPRDLSKNLLVGRSLPRELLALAGEIDEDPLGDGELEFLLEADVDKAEVEVGAMDSGLRIVGLWNRLLFGVDGNLGVGVNAEAELNDC